MFNVCYFTFLQVAQVCAYELGIPMETVNVKATNSMTSSNSITTGGSITSMNCCEVNSCHLLIHLLQNVFVKAHENTVYFSPCKECFFFIQLTHKLVLYLSPTLCCLLEP